MTGKSGSREKKRTFLSLLSKNNNINEKKKSTEFSWGPLWASPTRRIKKQKEEEEGRRAPNTIADFALTTPPNEPVARERNKFAVEEKNAEDASSGKRSFLEASLGGFPDNNATGDEDDEEEEETMKDETMTMAKEEKHPGGEKSPAAVGEKVGELLLSRTLASKPPMKGFAFLKSSEFEQFKENYWQRQKEMKGKKKTEHASMIPRGPAPPPPLEEKKKKKNVPKRRTTASSNEDDDVHQNSPPVVLRGHVYSVVVPSTTPSSESSSSRATREDRRRRSFLVKLEAQFGDDGQKWQALEAYVSLSSDSSEESE
ncbi:unnamed protein product [Bathycoccus prasinos]